MSKKGNSKPQMSFMAMVHFDAVFNILSDADDYIERKIRRWAVKELNISYFQTFEMSWPEILQHYYEANLVHTSKNELIEIAKTQYLEQLSLEEEAENAAFAKMIDEEEKERLQALEEAKKEKQSLEQDNDVPEIKEMNLNFDLKE